MAKKEKEQQYLLIKSMFESNNVKRMKDIEKIFPTMVAADMKMNHGRYIKKLYKPHDFSIKQIIKLASLIGINPNIIIDIIISEQVTKKTVKK